MTESRVMGGGGKECVWGGRVRVRVRLKVKVRAKYRD